MPITYLFITSYSILLNIEITLLSNSFLYYLLKVQEKNLGSFFLLTTIIGGIIILTLIYVSYKKYKGEQEHLNIKEKKEVRNKEN